MKLLKLIATGYKNCTDNFEISFVPVARKTAEDKEYELQEVAEGLFTYATVGIVGKNASGKTSAVELIDIAHSILSNFRLEKKQPVDGVELTIYFYHEGSIYKYKTRLEENLFNDSIYFRDQIIWRKEYFKSRAKNIFDEDGYDQMSFDMELPEDTSIVFFVFKRQLGSAVYFNSLDIGTRAYEIAFMTQKKFDVPQELLMKIIRVFDENITNLEMTEDHNYKLVFDGKEDILSAKDLYNRLSSGTTKGIVLYMIVAMSLITGFDLIIDEIENHFHKTLVENIISLYKDKSINRNNATLIFTTHYCEILDLFNRQDNIYIAKSDEKVRIYNMYRDFNIRTELLKSKQFYSDVFKTAVNYEALMDLKRALK